MKIIDNIVKVRAMKHWGVILLILIGMPMLISSCRDEDEPTPSPQKVESDAAGDFVVINVRTSDTLMVKGKSASSSYEEMTAHIGDTLIITFSPNANYENYSFEIIKNVFPISEARNKDGVIENKYVVSNNKGTYDIILSASSFGQTDDKIWNLTATGRFSLKIVYHAYVDYKLSCPNVLLKYATPQVTYVGNDGDTLRFTIPASEWKEFIIPESWDMEDEMSVVVIDGDTVVSESLKLMQWEKHIEYENYSIIDDEMKVTYIPKDNIPVGNVNKIENFSPSLSRSIEFVDDDGKLHKPYIFEISIGITIGSYTQTLYDAVSKYSDYRGCHIESNGTYDAYMHEIEKGI